MTAASLDLKETIVNGSNCLITNLPTSESLPQTHLRNPLEMREINAAVLTLSSGVEYMRLKIEGTETNSVDGRTGQEREGALGVCLASFDRNMTIRRCQQIDKWLTRKDCKVS